MASGRLFNVHFSDPGKAIGVSVCLSVSAQ